MKKAPGKSHSEGISLEKLFQMFPDDATVEKWFAEQRWPDGAHCPHCGSTNVSRARHKTMPYLCRERECRKRFSVRIGTPMECSKLGYKIWAIAIYLMTTSVKGVSSMKLHRDLGITQERGIIYLSGVGLPHISESLPLTSMPGIPYRSSTGTDTNRCKRR